LLSVLLLPLLLFVLCWGQLLPVKVFKLNSATPFSIRKVRYQSCLEKKFIVGLNQTKRTESMPRRQPQGLCCVFGCHTDAGAVNGSLLHRESLPHHRVFQAVISCSASLGREGFCFQLKCVRCHFVRRIALAT